MGGSGAGYRATGARDPERLQQVLSYRGLGFPLREIERMLDEPGGDALSRLRYQHALLARQIGRLQRMLGALEKEMEAYQMGINLTPQERLEVFGGFDPQEYEQEAADRWGDTDAYRQSQRRASSCTKDDWAAIPAEGAPTNPRRPEPPPARAAPPPRV